MKIINPNYILEENNIFNLRQKEYKNIQNELHEMLNVVSHVGYKVKDLQIKNIVVSEEELFKTIKKNVVIKLTKIKQEEQEKNSTRKSEISLSMPIPELINGSYFMIGGRYKIPEFQLFDLPFIVGKDLSIKFRSNVCQLHVFRKPKDKLSIKITIFGKTFPFSLLLFAFYGPRVLASRFNNFENLENQKIYSDLYSILLDELYMLYDDYIKNNREDLYYIYEIGNYISKLDPKSKGEEVLFAISIIPHIDIIVKKFLTTNNLIEEFIEVIKNPNPDESLDFRNKRIRCIEYFILSSFSKAIFNFCLTVRKSRKSTFNINSAEIMQNVNVSEIIQFDFSINPIEELTKLTTISILGPGGFSRKNVPVKFRDIHESMFGRVCTVDTPDRENCGVVLRLLPSCMFEEKGLRFSENIPNKIPVSIPVLMVPFLANDDPTRLQMSASQMRQAVLLEQTEEPMIQSGFEGTFTEKTKFVKVAKENGKVIYKDNYFLIVKYETNEVEIFDISFRVIFVDNFDKFICYINSGDEFKKGDILAESSKFCNNGKITIGRNLLTGIMIYHGYNYEDGIVISDSLIKDDIFDSGGVKDLSFFIPKDKILLSLKNDEYKPLPNINEIIPYGRPYAILKKISCMSDISLSSIFEDEIELSCNKSVRIIEINIYINDVCAENIKEYQDWIKDIIIKQKTKENTLSENLKNIVDEDKLKDFESIYSKFFKNDELVNNENKFRRSIKGEKFEGIYVEIYGEYVRPIEYGDKVANRHGNKGVISKIVPKEQMPRLKDGTTLDIIINPLGIISRMNIGQLYECHLSMSLQDLKNNSLKMLSENKSQEEIKNYILEYIKIIDNTNCNWYYTQFESEINKINIDEQFIQDLFLIQPPFESINFDKLKQALEYTKTSFTYEVFDPLLNKTLQNPIVVGYNYFFRLSHIAEEKVSARGIGSYSRKTLQPTSGKKNGGGQRLGEMECACMIARDGLENLYECITLKSDSIKLKNEWIKDTLSNKIPELENIDKVSESVRLLNSYLTTLGIDIEKE